MKILKIFGKNSSIEVEVEKGSKRYECVLTFPFRDGNSQFFKMVDPEENLNLKDLMEEIICCVESHYSEKKLSVLQKLGTLNYLESEVEVCGESFDGSEIAYFVFVDVDTKRTIFLESSFDGGYIETQKTGQLEREAEKMIEELNEY